jgi:hypothetical protein
LLPSNDAIEQSKIESRADRPRGVQRSRSAKRGRARVVSTQFTQDDKTLFRRLMLVHLFLPNTIGIKGTHPHQSRSSGALITKAEADLIVEYFARDPERWIAWTDGDETPELSARAIWFPVLDRITWQVALEAEAWAHREYVRGLREHDARRFPTLDAWLEADIRGQLRYAGDEGGVPCVERTVRDERNQFVGSHVRRIGRRRICMCGAVYHQRVHNQSNCPTCGKLTRAERKKRQAQRAGIGEQHATT